MSTTDRTRLDGVLTHTPEKPVGDEPATRRRVPAVEIRHSWLFGVAVALLVLPTLVLYTAYLHTGAALFAAPGLCIACVPLLQALRRQDRVAFVPRPTILVIVLAAIGLTYISGVVGGARATADWWKHNALIADLVTRPWPVTYSEHDGASLVYSFGFHLPAALVGKALGGSIPAAHIALAGFMTVTYAVLMLSVAVLMPSRYRATLSVAALTLYSGAEALGTWIMTGTRDSKPSSFWIGEIVQYSSDATLVRWVPQHAISGWLLGALYLSAWRRPQWASSLLALVAAVAAGFWSPFTGAAGVALAAALILRTAFKRGRPAGALVISTGLALLLLAPMGVFLASAAGGQRLVLGPLSPTSYLLFVGLSVGLWASCALYGARDRAVLVVPVAGVLLLPLVSLGQWNDLVMRTSIPFLFVIQIVALDAWARSRDRKAVRTVLNCALVTAVVLGAPTVLNEFSQAVTSGKTDAPVLPESASWSGDLPDYLIRSGAEPGSAVWNQYLTCPVSDVDGLVGLRRCG